MTAGFINFQQNWYLHALNTYNWDTGGSSFTVLAALTSDSLNNCYLFSIVVFVVLHWGRWQLIVIWSDQAWLQPLSWSEWAWWQPLSCSIIVTRPHWDDLQCWRSRFNVKMLWWCTTQNDGSWSWSLFNVDEGKFCLPLYLMMGWQKSVIEGS